MKDKLITIIRYYPGNPRTALITAVAALLLLFAVSIIEKFSGISAELRIFILAVAGIVLALNLLKTIAGPGKLYRYAKRAIIGIASAVLVILMLLIAWYVFCFFPDDQKYLNNIAQSVSVQKGARERVETDLVRSIDKISFSSPLTDNDQKILLAPERGAEDIYIDKDPYAQSRSVNGLKYSTGRIFYYIYQKKSIVIKGNSSARIDVGSGKKRFLSFDAVVPPLAPASANLSVNVYYTSGSRKLIMSRPLKQEIKSSVRPFRYSNLLKSIMFYIKHPARSVLTDNTGWESVKLPIPDNAGTVEIEFDDPSGKNYLFAGSPKILTVDSSDSKKRLRFVYLLFDIFSKEHIDMYEYPELFASQEPGRAVESLGYMRAITPKLDHYADRSLLFTRMYSVGQVTRPSIVPLWTSKPYAISRMPVFRNIVSKDNREEYYAMKFPSVPDTFSKQGYFTKQISCNAQGHGVSGVGVDLGFDENYDYTLEPSEHPENARRIIEFLQENQNRDFLLYAHINIPHPPKWIPLNYYLRALWDTDFNHGLAVQRGNIRYLDDCFGIIMKAFHKLQLDSDTVVIVAADHTGSPSPLIRGKNSQARSSKPVSKDSQSIAASFSHSVFKKSGGDNLHEDTVNIPWVVILPKQLKIKHGFNDTVVSAIDIGPTFADMAGISSDNGFDGRSFKKYFYQPEEKGKVHSARIPFIGRFQSGILIDGKYKYWQNNTGLYKYRTGSDGKKYIMQQEYLFDLSVDPKESYNLALDMRNPSLLSSVRNEYLKSYVDYPDKNFIQFSPEADKKPLSYKVSIVSDGQIIHPKKYGDSVTYSLINRNSLELLASVKDKTLIASFETNPPDAGITISIYRNGVLVPRTDIFTAVENINFFSNPIKIKTADDRYIARTPALTGLETSVNKGKVSYYRISLMYWLELNTSEKDASLSPGIKEVLRGWGYIQ